MRERDVEAYLRGRAIALGGEAYKWVSPGQRGVPDRIVLLPGGGLAFVELKAPGKKAGPVQTRVQARLKELGFPVYADVDSLEKVDRLLAEVGECPI